MEITRATLTDVLLIRPKVFRDERGFFLEAWNQDRFDAAVGHKVEFLQDNHSRSIKGVLRGVHYQVAPMAQAKLITVLRGQIFDVAVDLRPDSPTYSQWIGEVLTDEAREMLWIPEGFAHGFLVLSDFADVAYKTTNFYSPAHERCLKWNDQRLAVEWPLSGTPLVSAKDEMGEGFENLKTEKLKS